MVQTQYPRGNSVASMPTSYNEIKVRMGFGRDVDPNEYQRRKYEFTFAPASLPASVKRRPIRNFLVNALDSFLQSR